MIGPKAQLVAPGQFVAFQLSGATLVEGDTVTITYGDTSGGSPGYRVPQFESDALRLPLYIDFQGDEQYLSPMWPSFSTQGGTATGVTVLAPSAMSAGAEFEITLLTHDRYFNRATGDIPAYTLSVDGEAGRTVPAGGAAYQQINGLRIEQPGVYRIEAESESGGLYGRSNPILVKHELDHGIYWGDTHAHIHYGEGLGSIQHFFRHAREDARLDFVSLTEHDVFMDDFEWSTLVQAAKDYYQPETFITYLGYEWSVNFANGGHHNVLFRDIANRDRVPMQDAPTLEQLYEGLHQGNDARDIVTIPHAHMPGDWNLSDADLERVVEITSMHGSFEWFGDNYLQQGHRIGFVGASDDHRARPGLTGTNPVGLEQYGGLGAVFAPAKSRDAIFDGLRRRATYATTSERIVLDVQANGTLMGSHLMAPAKVRIQGNVHGTAPIRSMQVVKNGETVWKEDLVATDLTPDCAVLLAFDSEANPKTLDVPRGTRPWTGTITVNGATLHRVDPIGFDNVYNEYALATEEDPNTIKFHCETRGRANTLLLHLRAASEVTEIVVSLEAAEEGIRLLSASGTRSFPAATISLPFAELGNGTVARDASIEAIAATVSATVIDPAAPLDRPLDYTDNAPSKGDYYYLRVDQIDGAIAWSSPWWVTGETPQR